MLQLFARQLQIFYGKYQGFYRSGKTGKCHGNLCCQGKSGKNMIFEKSGKMILDHADLSLIHI